MTEEERAEKWSKGISQMADLTLAEKKLICHKVAVQLASICIF